MNNTLHKFKLDNKVAVITGGAGFMGVQHAEAIAEAGGTPVLWDVDKENVLSQSARICKKYGVASVGMKVDVSNDEAVKKGLSDIILNFKRIDILINNAAIDPKVKINQDESWSRFENMSQRMWDLDISVGLTGVFFCCQIVGSYMARNDGGVILNIASDLSVISPDQRIYRKDGFAEDHQPVKPVTYSVIKHGLIGLTKYLATYWAEKNIRVNAISPGGVFTGQPQEFVEKLTNLIPTGRMACKDEYKAAIVFLCSEASSYMTGQNLIMDGGRTVW